MSLFFACSEEEKPCKKGPPLYKYFALAAPGQALQSVEPVREEVRPPLRLRGHFYRLPQPALLFPLSRLHHHDDAYRALPLFPGATKRNAPRLVDTLRAAFHRTIHHSLLDALRSHGL